MFEINANVFFVEGALRGAIYNFNDGKVYSINNAGCKCINQYHNSILNNSSYLDFLRDLNLIKDSYVGKGFPEIPIPLATPDFVWLELTNRCNNKCIHCYQGATHKELPFTLTLNKWKDVLLQLKKLGCNSVEFIGGEPCLSPYITDLILYAFELNFKSIHMYTNLTVFDDNLVDIVKKTNTLIHFSLYGVDSNSHDAITQNSGSFLKTLYWIRRLQKENITLLPRVIAMRENQNIIWKMKTFIESLGLLYTPFDILRSCSTGSKSAHSPTEPEILNAVLRTKASFRADFNFFKKSMYCNTCWFGKFAVASNGDVYPCEFFRDITYGSFVNNNLEEILNNVALTKYWYLNYSKITTCRDCEYRYACHDCRLLGMLNNNLLEQNRRCLYNPYTGEWRT